MKTSLFARNFMIYAMVIVLGFTLLGSSFIYQVNRFSGEETQQQLNDTMQQAWASTQAYFQLRDNADWNDKFNASYRVALNMLARDSGGTIFVGDETGKLLFVANEDGCFSQENTGLMLPVAAMEDLLSDGVYTMNATFYGYLSAMHYILGQIVTDTGDEPVGVLFVCVPSQAQADLFLKLSRVFILLTITVLLLTLIATILVVRNMVRPLKNIAIAARKFAAGDLSARAPLPKYQDELYDMTTSFNSMAESMQNSEEARRGLIASVSHDLRTPMTTIAGFVDGILDGTIKPERQEHYLRIISEEIKRLARMANSMLAVSRLENGREMEKNVVDLSEMVRRIVISFEQKLNEKKIEVELDIPERQNLKAEHDSIFQAVYNLMDNAVKFTEQGGSITVYMAETGGKLQFNIINTGSEIPPEKRKFVFDRFYKGDTSRNSNSTGSGLGLYITKTVIKQHGGDIFVRSGEGKTEFCFTLPLTR
ncbi:MAG: HAMP domain-containing histidine kinase [Clostridia bacterium]|nr:HAMP domain-containing histidine kinase [Clostridia bacterium]